MPAVGLHHFAPDVDPRKVSDRLRRFGYAIVDDVADQALLDRLEAEAMPYIEASAAGRDEYDGRFTRHTGALVARCPSARRLVMHPLVVGAVGHFLGHASAMQLHLTQIISVEAGETRQKLHRDEMAFDFFDFGPDYHVQCNTMWALTDFTAGNGATWILPESSGQDDDTALQSAGAQGRDGPGKRAVLRRQGAPRRRSKHQRRRAPGREPPSIRSINGARDITAHPARHLSGPLPFWTAVCPAATDNGRGGGR